MEETNIPSQLTYHEPEPDKGNSTERHAVQGIARHFRGIHPFHAPVRSVRLAFYVHLPPHPAPPVQADRTLHRVLLHHPAAHARHLPDAENQRMDASRTGQARTPVRPLRAHHPELCRMRPHHVPLPLAPLHGRHHRSHPALHGHLRTYQHQVENQHPYGKQRHDGRRIALVQLYLPVQSHRMALRLHPACRHAGLGTHHRPPAHIKRSGKRILRRAVLRSHRNLVYLNLKKHCMSRWSSSKWHVPWA